MVEEFTVDTVQELTQAWRRSYVKADVLQSDVRTTQAVTLAEQSSHNLAIIVGLSIRNAWAPRYAPTRAKLIALLKLEICMYGQKSAWDNAETHPVGKRILRNQMWPLVTELLQKYISSLQETRNPRLPMFIFWNCPVTDFFNVSITLCPNTLYRGFICSYFFLGKVPVSSFKPLLLLRLIPAQMWRLRWLHTPQTELPNLHCVKAWYSTSVSISGGVA